MKITVLTLFPEMYENFVSTSIIGRAVNKGLVDIEFVNIRDFALDKFKHVDDKPFGGGHGQLMKCQPVLDALNSVKADNSYTLMMSPLGKVYNQKKARELSEKDHLIIICGHYEGLDYRINKHCDELVTIGDYILTGGEMASMVIMDSVIRLLKGSIKEESTTDESYENDLLEYPQYTQPANYNGDEVPSVLTSGNHAKIREWRIRQSILLTYQNRRDLFDKHEFSEEEKKILQKLIDEKEIILE